MLPLDQSSDQASWEQNNRNRFSASIVQLPTVGHHWNDLDILLDQQNQVGQAQSKLARLLQL
jgi:hypothetical protein